MANIHLSKRVKEIIEPYSYLLPKHYCEIKDYTYVFISSQEMNIYHTNKIVTFIVVREDELKEIEEYNYIENDPLKISSLIQVLYCSSYHYFKQRNINLKINKEQISNISYMLIDDTRELINCFKHHIPHITLFIICFYTLIGLMCFPLSLFQLNHLLYAMIGLCLLTLILLYIFLILFNFVYLKITQLLLMKNHLNKEYQFYCLSDCIEGVELWTF